jgi:hypothetical protein
VVWEGDCEVSPYPDCSVLPLITVLFLALSTLLYLQELHRVFAFVFGLEKMHRF